MPLEPLLPLLLDLLAKSVAVLLLAAGAAYVFRRASAANRHLIWLAAFLTLLLLPFTKLARPLWSYEWRQEKAVPVMAVLPQVDARAVLLASPIELRQPAPAAKLPSWIPRINWPAVVIAVWLAGGLIMLAHRLAVGLQMRRLVRTSRLLENEPALSIWRKLTVSRVPLRMSDQCRVPMVVGVVRPVVLLPLGALEWTDARLTSALQHELGHLRRGDCLTRLLADGLCASGSRPATCV